ncbi:MAG: modification methylase [Clostridia bacterium]|nr:modification methylase [Clostridia bacterium]
MSNKEQIIEVDKLPIDITNGATYSINQSNPNSYTHGMFKYPCKFIPEIPRWGIKKFLSDKSEVVFDPFCGSGTTLLEANIHGINAFGTEIDDIAKLIVHVKTTVFTKQQIERLNDEYTNIVKTLTNNTAECFSPAIVNLEHWFPYKTILELGRIKKHIDSIADEAIKNFFKLCLISIIKKVSYADDTSPKPYVSNKIKKSPPSVDKEFASTFKRYIQMSKDITTIENFGYTQILDGDALSFTCPTKFDLAITSPPYINAFDYGRTMRLENLWLETLTEEELRNKKSQYVGTEKINLKLEKTNLSILEKSNLLQEYYNLILAKDEKRALVVKKFFEDMETNLRQVYIQMKNGGKYIVVIGNSSIRNVEIESWKVIEQLAHIIGFNTLEYFSYIIQNPYIRIPRKGRGGKINKDYVLVLEKGD